MEGKREITGEGYKPGDTLVSERRAALEAGRQRPATVEVVEAPSDEERRECEKTNREILEVLAELHSMREKRNGCVERDTLLSGSQRRGARGGPREPKGEWFASLEKGQIDFEKRYDVCDKIMQIFDLFGKDKGSFMECRKEFDFLSTVFLAATPVKFFVRGEEVVMDKEDLMKVVCGFEEDDFMEVAKAVAIILDCL